MIKKPAKKSNHVIRTKEQLQTELKRTQTAARKLRRKNKDLGYDLEFSENNRKSLESSLAKKTELLERVDTSLDALLERTAIAKKLLYMEHEVKQLTHIVSEYTLSFQRQINSTAAEMFAKVNKKS